MVATVGLHRMSDLTACVAYPCASAAEAAVLQKMDASSPPLWWKQKPVALTQERTAASDSAGGLTASECPPPVVE